MVSGEPLRRQPVVSRTTVYTIAHFFSTHKSFSRCSLEYVISSGSAKEAKLQALWMGRGLCVAGAT